MGYFIKNIGVGRKPTGPAIPVGTTADRPSNPPATGTIRYNTDTDTFEYWNGVMYVSMAVRGEVDLVVDTFTADGIQATFTMSQEASAAKQIMVFVGGIYQIPETNYTVSNTDLQFVTTPPTDNLINVIHRLGSTVVADLIDVFDPATLLNISGGIYEPPVFDPTPDPDADGGTYDPIDTSPAGTHYEGGFY